MNTATSVLFGTTKQGGVLSTSKAQSSVKTTVYVSDRARLVNQYTQFAVKTAQSTVEMCRVVFEAKEELKDDEFEMFCRDIGHSKKDPTIRKYLAIGAQYERLIQYAELLPNAWTSIYQITLLPADVFDALVATESSMANLTGAQIKKLMGKESDDKSKSAAVDAAATTAAISDGVSADKSSQTTSEASQDDEAASSSTDTTEAATASSDASEADSSKSIADENEVSTDQTDDTSSIEFDRVFAKQATSTMLEQAASAAASTTVEVEDEEAFEPYEITIRFNSKPSNVAVAALVESLLTIKSKHRLDFEIVQQKALVM